MKRLPQSQRDLQNTFIRPLSHAKIESEAFYQGVASGGIEQQFRYGGHAEYNLDFDFGRLCGWDGFTLELGSEHRFGESVNRSAGSVIPVALSLNLPEPETIDLALIEVRFGFEFSEDVELQSQSD